MSVLTAPARPVAVTRRPPEPQAAARRTMIGFVATRRVVEVVLTVVLGVGAGLLFRA